MKMDFLPIAAASSMIGLFTILFLTLPFLSKILSNQKSNKNASHLPAPPQPSGALPIIGHLHLIKHRRPFVLYLADLADKLGPIFTLRVGSRRIVILSSSEAAKDSYTTCDKALSNRPSSTIGDLMAYNRSMIVFAPYGPYWRAVRRIASTELLSNSHLNALSRVAIKEVCICIKDLFSQYASNSMQPIKVEMMSWLGDINYNVVLDMIVSKRYFRSGNGGSEDFSKFREGIDEFIRLIGAFIPGDIFPCLKWIDFGGHKKVMRATFRDMDAVLSALLDDHKKRRLFREEGDDLDFMDVVLAAAMDDPEFSEYDQDTVVKATSLSMIMGGTHTTTLYLRWTLALLLNNRLVMDKVRAEIDEKVGKERLVEQSDIKNLVYWSAVIKEAFRLCPAGELMVSREASEDCHISGYHIPKGYYVAVNVWKLQRDPVVWPDPLEFKPERFLTSHAAGIDVRGQHYELLPFRAGRRACPGSSFSIQVMDLVLTRLIQAFDLETPGQVPVEMNQSLGLLKAKSMEVMLTPRLSRKLYEEH